MGMLTGSICGGYQSEKLGRKKSLLQAMKDIEENEGVDQILFFVIDILNEEATLFVPNKLVKEI